MIYGSPARAEPVDQGDIIDGCPILRVKEFQLDSLQPLVIDYDFRLVVVVTQTCDLANEKRSVANVAEVFDAQALIDQHLLKASDIKGPLRAGRVWGMYFLPAAPDLGLPETIVDLRRLHTVRLDVLVALCRSGKRKARLQPPYREHLAKHFADTYSRIGLPQPYATI